MEIPNFSARDSLGTYASSALRDRLLFGDLFMEIYWEVWKSKHSLKKWEKVDFC